MTPPRALSLLALLGVIGGGAAHAEAAVSASRCAADVVEVAELERLLRLELSTSPVFGDGAALPDAGIDLDCAEGPARLVVSFARDRTRRQLRVDLDRLPSALRARTLALATAELLRDKPEPPVEPAAVVAPPPPSLTVSTVVSPAPPAASPRLRLTRDLSIGFGVSSAAALGAGIPLLVVGLASVGLPQHQSIAGSGIAFTTIGVLTLAGTITSAVLWSRERRRLRSAM